MLIKIAGNNKFGMKREYVLQDFFNSKLFKNYNFDRDYLFPSYDINDYKGPNKEVTCKYIKNDDNFKRFCKIINTFINDNLNNDLKFYTAIINDCNLEYRNYFDFENGLINNDNLGIIYSHYLAQGKLNFSTNNSYRYANEEDDKDKRIIYITNNYGF